MTLTLRIENYDVLDNGGPAVLHLEGRGASVGRGRAMDWVLPDPARHVSSHHFDIAFGDNAYWVTDVSTNGTFLQGQRYRLEGPHRLSTGERLVVGHYIIAVEATVQAPAPQPAAPQGLVQAPPSGGTWTGIGRGEDPWDLGNAPLQPVNPLPGPSGAHRLDDVAQDFVPFQAPARVRTGLTSGLQQPPGMAPAPPAPPVRPLPVSAQPAPPPQVAPPPSPPQVAPPQPPAQAPSPQMAPPASPSAPQMAADGGPLPQVPPVSRLPEPPVSHVPVPPPAIPASAAPQATPPISRLPQPVSAAQAQTHFPRSPAPTPAVAAPQAPAPVAPVAGGDAVLRAFCEGAGLPPEMAAGLDPVALARILGQTMRVTTDEVMRMLQDRASVKYFTKGGERTMRSATDNNPLKFLPDADQALEVLFLKPRDGFMSGTAGFESALRDLRQHQIAVFAAMQPALAEVLNGLAPEQIEAVAAEGASALQNLGGSRRARLWDKFVATWDAKADTGDNGMLDAYLQAFARAYNEANARTQ